MPAAVRAVGILGVLIVAFLMSIPAAQGSPLAARNATSDLHFSASGSPNGPAYGQDTWQEFQHDSSNSGLSGDTPVASSYSWPKAANLSSFRDGPDAPWVSSPIVGEGMVFLAHGNNVTAYNMTTGLQAWNTTLQGSAPGVAVDSTPTLWRGTLFLAQDEAGYAGCVGAGCSSDLFALNASTGSILQSVVAGASATGWQGYEAANSPVPLAGSDFDGQSGVLFTDFRGYLYTYTWNSATSSLTSLSYNGPNRVAGTRTTSTPAIALLPGVGTAGANVWSAFYLDAGVGGGHSVVRAYEIDAANPFPASPGYPSLNGLGGGQDLTWHSTNTGSIAVANVSGGGTQGWPYGFFGDDAGDGAVSHLVAMNLTAVTYPATALLQGSKAYLDSGLLSTPAIISDSGSLVDLLVSDLNGTVSHWVFTTTGSGAGTLVQTWNRSLGSPLDGSPAIAGDTAYVVNSTGGLYALNVNTGLESWQANLSAPTRSNFALGYSRLFVLSDPIDGATGGALANLTAFGPPAGPVVNTLHVAVTTSPTPLASGGTALLVAHATWSSPVGRGSGPATGASVYFNVSGVSGGSTAGSPATVKPNGYAYANWTAPSSSPVWYNASLSTSVLDPLNTSAHASSLIPVEPGTVVTTGPTPLFLSISPQSSELSAGASETFYFNATTTDGVSVAGAAITLSKVGAGTWATTTGLVTGATGSITDVFTAPATATVASATLVSATAVESGYTGASASAVIEIPATSTTVPPGASFLNVALSPLTASVKVGVVVEVEADVTNASSGLAVDGAALSATSYGSGSGSFASKSATTNSFGLAWFNFTTATAGSVLVNVSAAAPHYVSVVASVAISIVSSSTTTPPPTNTTSTTSGSSTALRPLDWALIALAVGLVIALALAIGFGGRRKEHGTPPPYLAAGAAAAAVAPIPSPAPAPAATAGGTVAEEPPAEPAPEEPPAEPASTPSEAPPEAAPSPAPTDEDTSPIHVEEAPDPSPPPEGPGSGDVGPPSPSDPGAPSSPPGE